MQQNEQLPETYQIESLITDHEQVVDAKVITIPHPEKGELIVAWVIANDSALTKEEIVKYCDRSNDISTPNYVLFTDEFPTTPSGKIQKIRLKEKALELINE
ncbi:AMP-binding enzyme [Alkalibacillus haloalkaliphilus]|uniref:AMP-binding enzyme C-terminal domain-containing protein n=1 Tax=Alkalibacillus haloalkaliphilus TaxID=94136 RepID=A0A511W1S9_9BACI|nr:hypothetical protein [Alkalibacillus haloalkaliphilus]GEN45039.1 hypothetical protein AHA02nite_08150 [Alkalibacillus haloalkaliphilus]